MCEHLNPTRRQLLRSFVAGSLFMAKYAGRLQTGLWVFISTLGMGISGVFYGLSPTIAVGIVWVMLSGFFNSPIMFRLPNWS